MKNGDSDFTKILDGNGTDLTEALSVREIQIQISSTETPIAILHCFVKELDIEMDNTGILYDFGDQPNPVSPTLIE